MATIIQESNLSHQALHGTRGIPENNLLPGLHGEFKASMDYIAEPNSQILSPRTNELPTQPPSPWDFPLIPQKEVKTNTAHAASRSRKCGETPLGSQGAALAQKAAAGSESQPSE